MITVVDYGMGNLGSIINMFERLGIRARLSSSAKEIEAAERLILPGVGAFDQGMQQIRARDLRGPLDSAVLDQKRPLLGICLGMQLLGRGSEEGNEPGLGWISGAAKRFSPVPDQTGQTDKVPHMGWNYLTSAPHPVLNDLGSDPRFYFVHSYHVVCDDARDVVAASWYGGAPFAAGIAHGNVIGMQFHPEKSHKYGMKLLQNFAQWQPT